VSRGVYAEQLERWFAAYPRDRFLILRSEGFYAETAEWYRRILEFLGVHSWAPSDFANYSHGEREQPRGKMPPDIRDELTEFFAPHNKRLSALLGSNFDWQ
jgi:hypothetical protein